MELFRLEHPTCPPIPVLVEVPHAGLAIPDGLSDQLVVYPKAVERDADIYVDKLVAKCASKGATLLSSRVSRHVVDLNRAPDDVDRSTVANYPAPRPIQPRGVVWRLATDGSPILRKPLSHPEFLSRLERFYQPYHATLRREISRLHNAHGHVVVIAAHSMPSTGADGNRRADLVPGTRGRTSAAGSLVDLVGEHFLSRGLSVRHDEPYRGGFTTSHYGRPSLGIHVIQLEINRGLYIDERTLKPKPSAMAELSRMLLELIELLGQFSGST